MSVHQLEYLSGQRSVNRLDLQKGQMMDLCLVKVWE